jgi:hypothetical protein
MLSTRVTPQGNEHHQGWFNLVSFLKKVAESLVFWFVLTIILDLLFLLGMREVFIRWGFNGDEGLVLSIFMGFPVLIGLYTAYKTTKIEKTLLTSSQPKFCKLHVIRGNWAWRMLVLLVAVFCTSETYKYLLSTDFTKALVIIAISIASTYVLSILVEILSYTSKLSRTR